MALHLDLRHGESVTFMDGGRAMSVRVVSSSGGRVRLHVSAPEDVEIIRPGKRSVDVTAEKGAIMPAKT